MRDRTDEVRTVVEGYDRFEFIPLRIEDAFDSSWWEKTGGRPLGLDLGVNITNEGLYTVFLDFWSFYEDCFRTCFVININDVGGRQSSCASEVFHDLPSNSDCHTNDSTNSDPTTTPTYSAFYSVFSPTIRNITNVTLHWAYIIYLAGRGICSEGRNSRGVEQE